MSKTLTVTLLLLLVLIAACSPSAASTPMPSSGAAATTVGATEEVSALEAVARSGADRPAWLATPLVKASTSEPFTLSNFPGKTVYVELMATWCTNCRIQQGNVRSVREKLGDDNYVFISLSVEPNDTTAALAQYEVQYNYPWVFAIAPKDMVAGMIEQFGTQSVINPTATPHFIISPNGSVSQLETGIHTADQLTAELTTAAGA